MGFLSGVRVGRLGLVDPHDGAARWRSAPIVVDHGEPTRRWVAEQLESRTSAVGDSPPFADERFGVRMMDRYPIDSALQQHRGARGGAARRATRAPRAHPTSREK